MFEQYSVSNETEAIKIAKDLQENFRNVLKNYRGSEHSGFDESVKTVYRLGALLNMADNAISWFSAHGRKASWDYPIYMNQIVEGVEYLKDELPDTLDNRLMNAVLEEGYQPQVDE